MANQISHTISIREEKDADGNVQEFKVFHFTELGKSVAAENYTEALINFEKAFGVVADEEDTRVREYKQNQERKAVARKAHLRSKQEV